MDAHDDSKEDLVLGVRDDGREFRPWDHAGCSASESPWHGWSGDGSLQCVCDIGGRAARRSVCGARLATGTSRRGCAAVSTRVASRPDWGCHMALVGRESLDRAHGVNCGPHRPDVPIGARLGMHDRASGALELALMTWEQGVLAVMASVDLPDADSVRESLTHLVWMVGCGWAWFSVRGSGFPHSRARVPRV